MADAIPTPAAPTAQNTVVTQPPMTVWDALKAAGWWTAYDWIMFLLVSSAWLGIIAWKLFGSPTIIQLLTVVLIALSLKLAWLISLVFRCSYFVLRLNAELATLPEASARIAVAYLSGKQ
jgi:hypothetical protein